MILNNLNCARNPDIQAKLVQLEHQVNDLKEERNGLYINQAMNAQKILVLMDSQKELNEKYETTTQSYKSLNHRVSSF